MSIDSEQKRLLQINKLERIRQNPKATDMIPVYRWIRDEKFEHINHFFLCALIPPDQIDRMLSNTGIDNYEANALYGMPSAFESVTENGQKQIRYHRYGIENGIEPLVICRSFPEGMENYCEISEEFRHFHDLYHNKGTDEYIKIDSNGRKEVIAVIKPDEVKIRLKEIRQFLAIKEMYLSILFEFNEYSEHSVQELELNKVENSERVGLNKPSSQSYPSEIFGEFQSEDLICWTFSHVDTPYREFRSDSRLRGRKLIEPLPKSKSGFGDFAEKTEQYAEFIVDVDDNGDEVWQTCNPYKLNDFPIKDSDPAWSLNPVHFNKHVLEKYYNEPSKYSVEDSILRCGISWSMKIDNHDPNKVCVILKDLHHLPYKEQQYWTSFCIIPEGGVSQTFFNRMIKGKFMDSDQPDILFKQNYKQLQKACEECLGWLFLKPLSPDNQYHLQRLRIPINDEQCYFDDLVQDLQIILIESLNVKELKKLLPAAVKETLKGKQGIEILKEVLSFYAFEDFDNQIVFLQKLQALRSQGSGHLKGRSYQKIAEHFNINSLGQQQAFAEILKHALDTVNFFATVVRSGKF